VHRDLKPANVMVGRFGEVYVMDWGVARVVAHDASRERSTTAIDLADLSRPAPGSRADGAVTHDGTILGTPGFMAPEQAAGDLAAVGPAADVWSVGAMLYVLLCGHTPYRHPGGATDAAAILLQQRREPPPSPHTLDRTAPVELVAICEKAMQHDPAQRYATMTALADDLRAYLDDRVVRAHRTGAMAEFRKWVRRHRGAASGIFASALLAVIGAVWIWSVETRASADVRAARDAALRQAYVANLAAADASLRTVEIAEAVRRLHGCDASLRAFEWHHLRLRTDSALRVLRLGDASIEALALAPDGARFVAGRADGTLCTVDIESGAIVGEAAGHPTRICGATWSPDGRRLATASWDNTARLWNAATLALEHELAGHQFPVAAVAFAPDGTSLATAGWDDTVRLWNVRTGQPLRTLTGHEDGVLCVAFSADGTTCSCSRTARRRANATAGAVPHPRPSGSSRTATPGV
jgi:hypothetical protein